MLKNSVKIKQLSIENIRIEHLASEQNFVTKKVISVHSFDIEKEPLEILLTLHPIVLNQNFELIGGINSYLEWSKFIYLNPLDKEQKFNVLIFNQPLSNSEYELIKDSENLYQELFLSKYFRSPQELLKTAQENIPKIKCYKPNLVKQNGAIHASYFSKELGQKNIRTKRNS